MLLATHGIVKNNSSAAPAFAPTDLSGLKLWADANDFVSSGAISQWNDKSGLNNHLIQATGASQPSVVLNVQNSKPIVRFDGVNDFFNLTTTISSSTDWTAVYVMKAFDASSNIAGLAYGGGESLYPILQFGSSTYASIAVGYISVVNSVTSFCAMTGTRSVNTLGLKKNNVALTTTFTSVTRVVGDISMFGKVGVYPSKGDFAEAVFYNRVLTTQEMIDLNTYLVAKWAL